MHKDNVQNKNADSTLLEENTFAKLFFSLEKIFKKFINSYI